MIHPCIYIFYILWLGLSHAAHSRLVSAKRCNVSEDSVMDIVWIYMNASSEDESQKEKRDWEVPPLRHETAQYALRGCESKWAIIQSRVIASTLASRNSSCSSVIGQGVPHLHPVDIVIFVGVQDG